MIASAPRRALFVIVAALVAAVVGLALGWVVGGVLYEVTGPPWGQLGDLESLKWVINGALAGGVLCAIVAGVVAGRVRHESRGRARLGAVLGGAFGGTAGGLGTFPATAPLWVGPVLLVAAVGSESHACSSFLASLVWRRG